MILFFGSGWQNVFSPPLAVRCFGRAEPPRRVPKIACTSREGSNGRAPGQICRIFPHIHG
jgi:hypothetical protein